MNPKKKAGLALICATALISASQAYCWEWNNLGGQPAAVQKVEKSEPQVRFKTIRNNKGKLIGSLAAASVCALIALKKPQYLRFVTLNLKEAAIVVKPRVQQSFSKMQAVGTKVSAKFSDTLWRTKMMVKRTRRALKRRNGRIERAKYMEKNHDAIITNIKDVYLPDGPTSV